MEADAKNLDAYQLVASVVQAFLDTGKDLTAAEIAERTGWGLSKVRRLLSGGPGGGGVGPAGRLSRYQDTVPTYSRNYPMMQAGTARVWKYGPTREMLRARMLQAGVR